MNACFCIGPQDGQPLCPCAMRNESAKDMELRLLRDRVKQLERGQSRMGPRGNRHLAPEPGFDTSKLKKELHERIIGAIQIPNPIQC